jgi:hypothetical protein
LEATAGEKILPSFFILMENEVQHALGGKQWLKRYA